MVKKYKMQNLHTHSTYCDGADTPEEIVKTAIEKGFSGIGFSSHSYMHFSAGKSMPESRKNEYKNEILKLKDKYKEKIDVFCGLEVELYSEVDLSGYDYLIGSVHYLKFGDKYVGFDRNQDVVQNVIDEYFDGDGMKYAKEYYKTLAKLPEYGDFDIIGHFDLICKHSDNIKFFDEDSEEYIDAAFKAAQKLAGKIPYFEVNTGAISRGYRKSPYPSVTILKELKRLGFGPIITSDCHDRNYLDCHFEECVNLLKKCGFKDRYILTDNGFCAAGL